MPATPTRTPKAKTTLKATPTAKSAVRAPVLREKSKTGKADAQPGPALNTQEREKLIAQAAYFRAEKRGFTPGYELQDWIEAEVEVLRLIGRA